MLHHVSLGVRNIEQAACFYDAALAPLGYIRVWSDLRPGESGQAVGYGPAGSDDKLALKQVPELAATMPGLHIAFSAPTRLAVAAFHAAALSAGGRDNGPPGLRPDYGHNYFAAFVLDPEGHRLEAVCKIQARPQEPEKNPVTLLRPMRAGSYAAYLEAAVVSYAHDNVAAGRWPDAGAVERSRADFESLLPQGLATPDNHIYEIIAPADDRVVGFAWVAIEKKFGTVSAYIYDLEVKPEFRRRGHATRALQSLESVAAAAGATRIGLNVFARNTQAQALYQKLGYEPTNLNMYKPLVPGSDQPL